MIDYEISKNITHTCTHIISINILAVQNVYKTDLYANSTLKLRIEFEYIKKYQF